MKSFMEFIREQGVTGLAVGFILGAAIGKLVTALVTDLISPFLGIILGAGGGLQAASFKVGSVEVLFGHFISNLIDFTVIALVVYIGVKKLGLDKLDKAKS
jgi:large conductance mechanosensitive channel